MRRIALISDIHGNDVALEAVLGDIDRVGIDETYCLGDLVGYGPSPAVVVSRIRAAGIPTVMGNYDEGVGGRLGGCGCFYASEQAKLDGEASYAFTVGALVEADLAWISALPPHIRLEVDGLRILLAHGSPRRVNEYLLPDRPERQLIRLADEANADIVCVGHTHTPYHRALIDEGGRRVHYINSGSVGKPKDGDPRAGWVEVVIGPPTAVQSIIADDGAMGPTATGESWIGMNVHRVGYDVPSVAVRMDSAGLPRSLGEALRLGR